jgi:hypothetical protein
MRILLNIIKLISTEKQLFKLMMILKMKKMKKSNKMEMITKWKKIPMKKVGEKRRKD